MNSPATDMPNTGSRSRRRYLPRLLVGIALVAATVAVGRPYLSELDRLRSARMIPVLGIAALYLLSRATFGQVLRLTLVRLGIRIGRIEVFAAMMLMVYAGLIMSHLAAAAMAGYLYSRRRVPLADTGAALFFMNALQIAGVGLCGLATVAALALVGASNPSSRLGPLAALFAAAVVGGGVLTLVRFPLRLGWTGQFAVFLRRINGSLDRVGRSADVLVPALAWELVTLVLRGLRLQLAFAAVGQDFSFPGAMVASLAADLTVLVQLTPSGLGLREAAIGMAGHFVGAPPEAAIAAAVLDRLVWTTAVVVVTPVILLLCPRGGPRNDGLTFEGDMAALAGGEPRAAIDSSAA